MNHRMATSVIAWFLVASTASADDDPAIIALENAGASSDAMARKRANRSFS